MHNGAAIASKTCASGTAGQPTSGGSDDHIASSTTVLLPGWARRALRLPVEGPLATLASGAGHLGTGAVRWAMAGVADERQRVSEDA